MAESWNWKVGEKPSYDADQQALLDRLEADLESHMKAVKPRRFEHSLSVARTAEKMSLAYGTDPFSARAAGLLHDWDKVLSADEQIAKARELGLDFGVDYDLVSPLLHGMTAAATLPSAYPELGTEVWDAIKTHTLGGAHLSDLQMIVFVADGIEPLRKDVDAIRQTRKLVEEHAPLSEVYWSSFSKGVAYVIDTERYLYPKTLDIYNELVLARSR